MDTQSQGTPLAEGVRLAAEGLRQALIDQTSELIALPTPNPPGKGYKRCVEYLDSELGSLRLGPKVVKVPGSGPLGRYCLLAQLGEGEPTLHFHAHYDTVPGSRPEDYVPRVEAGRLHGRGSSDMKGGLAAMFGALRLLSQFGLPRRGRVLISLVPDEETGGRRGAAYLWESGHLKPGGVGMLMPEATSGIVWNGNRGALSSLIEVRGRPAHVGLAHQGLNAFRGLTLAAEALFALERSVRSRLTEVAVEPPSARASVMLVGGQGRSGSNFNVVPEMASCTVDRRTNPEERLGDVKAEIETAVREALAADGYAVTFDHFQEADASVVSPGTTVGQALARAVEVISGRPPTFAMCPGVCEIRFFNQRGVPAYAYGPGILAVSHGPREFVEVDRLVECAAIYALAAAQVLGG